MDNYKKIIWGSSAAAALAAVFIIIFVFLPGEKPGAEDESAGRERVETAPSEAPVIKEAEEEPEPSPEPLLDVGLQESDNVVRELVRACTGHPGLDRWLKNSDLIRLAVAVTVNIANGESPAVHLDSLLPAGRFRVITRSGKTYIDKRSYKRYDRAASVFASLDSAGLVSLYRRAGPLIEEAFKDLGYPDKKFADMLHRAMDILLAVPVIEKEIMLKEKVTTYMYADPRLEKLNPAQKHLLRMGPGNIKKIHDKLKEIAALLYP